MSALPSPAPHRSAATLDRFDRGFRRRITIALAVSVAINLVVFGYAGKLGHQFLRSLEVVREHDGQVNIRRVTLSPAQMQALRHPKNSATSMSTPSPSPTPAATAPAGADARP